MVTMQTFDPVCFDAFTRLLARPDPADLRYESDPNRRTTRLQPILMGWLQRRFLEVNVEEPLATAKRTPHRALGPSELAGLAPNGHRLTVFVWYSPRSAIAPTIIHVGRPPRNGPPSSSPRRKCV
jgi:hypothetical protein